MKKKQILRIFIFILVIGALVWYIANQQELLEALTKITFLDVIFIVMFQLLFLITNGLLLRTFLSKFEVDLAVKEWFGLSVITTMGNYLTPFSIGMIARATYLKKRYDFPYAQFVSLLVSNYLINFFVIGWVGIFVLAVFGPKGEYFWLVMAFFIIVIVLVIVFVVSPIGKLPWKNRIVNRINSTLEGWKLIRNDAALIGKLSVYALMNVFINGAAIWVSYSALGSKIVFWNAILIGLLTSFSLLIRITPGNVGIQEAVLGFSSTILNANSGQGVLVSLLLRGGMMVLVFILGPIYSYRLTNELSIFDYDEIGDEM